MTKRPGPRWCGIVVCSLLLSAVGSVSAQGREAEIAPLPNPLRLEHVLQLARSRRMEITAARAKERAAAQRSVLASALEDPILSPAVDHLPFMLHGADLSLTIEQRFPLSGVRGKKRRVAEADRERLQAEIKTVLLDVDLDALTAYFMLHERRQMFGVLGQQLTLSRALVTAANARYKSGTASQPDVLRAEVEVSRLEGSLVSLRSEVLAAEAMLNTSLARSANAAIPPTDSTPATTVPPDWTTVRDAALQGRPELLSGRAEIRRAEAEVTVMESMYAPMAMVRTGPAYTMTDGAGWMVMIGVSLPIWRDRLEAGVREAKAMLDMSRADVAAMRRMVEGETAAARHRVVSARDRYLALRDEILPRARRVIEPSLLGYGAGTLPLIGVIDAAQTLWSTEGELIGSEFDLGIAWARLHRAVAKPEPQP